MKISEIIKKRLELEKQLKTLTVSYEEQKEKYSNEIAKCKEQEKIIAKGFDLDKIELGRKLIAIQGNPYARTDDTCFNGDNVIAKCAIEDILNGCKKLKREYIGNKRYEGYYQRCDCKYGYGPSHGTIVDRIELVDTQKELNEDEIEAVVYYLTIFDQLPGEQKG